MTFYAYIYRDPSRNNEPIYVGKGKGKQLSAETRAKISASKKEKRRAKNQI